MMFAKWSLGKKIGVGFGTILLLLCVVGVWSLTGISGIVTNATEVIDGNQLKALMVEREVDHLKWAGQVADLIHDEEVTELNVQTDPQQCAFGKWYYSEDRKIAEAMVPGLDGLMAQIEEPHNHLHESAIEIGKVFVPADIQLGGFLRESKTGHLLWTGKVKDVFVEEGLTLSVETDPHKCEFGEWLYSEGTLANKDSDPRFAAIWNRVEKDHVHLHTGAVHVAEMLATNDTLAARSYFIKEIKPSAHKVLAGIDGFIEMNNNDVAGMQKAAEVYATQTAPNLHKVGSLLAKSGQMVSENVMTDEQMLRSAQST
ncbi:MAG: CZB domain-containing protein, partial [Gemmatimonadales bacterium]|nr:CZB domain-containing protein [Gemmatimonadales bacterium]